MKEQSLGKVISIERHPYFPTDKILVFEHRYSTRFDEYTNDMTVVRSLREFRRAYVSRSWAAISISLPGIISRDIHESLPHLKRIGEIILAHEFLPPPVYINNATEPQLFSSLDYWHKQVIAHQVYLVFVQRLLELGADEIVLDDYFQYIALAILLNTPDLRVVTHVWPASYERLLKMSLSLIGMRYPFICTCGASHE